MDKIKEIKENWYMCECESRVAETNIQYVVKIGEAILFMVKKYLSIDEISEINLDSYKFNNFAVSDFLKEGAA